MVTVHPSELKTQGFGETVVYALPWDAWDQDLAKAKRVAKVSLETLSGLPCSVTLLEDDRAKRVALVHVRSGAKGGHYQITRTVTTTTPPVEQRKRSFQVLVEAK